MTDVYISHAEQDARWATELAIRLRGYGLRVFLDECVLPGDVVLHARERAIRESTCGIAVISSAWLAAPQALDEYAALVHASEDRRLRFIPVLVGDVALPLFARTRVWRDFRDVHGQAYDDKADELAMVISGRQPKHQPTMPKENLQAAHLTGPAPITEPAQHAFVVCYAADDVGYSGKLIGWLRAAGLPVWSVGDLLPGDAHFRKIRQQLAYAIAVLVVMSPQSQDSEGITRMILEGQLRGRPFVPFFLRGDVNYHLASTWYFDARDGRLPGNDLLGMLRQFHDADAAGEQADPVKVLPPPPARPVVRAVRVPQSAGLDRLDRYLSERKFGYADLHTTSLVLESANRLGVGWMRERDGRELPLSLIAGIDALWSRYSGGLQGFQAQLGLAQVRHGRHAEFLALSAACGWQDNEDASVCRSYEEFSERAIEGRRAGFFPTLRNPQSEQRHDWYDRWETTVLAVHLRLQEWKGTT